MAGFARSIRLLDDRLKALPPLRYRRYAGDGTWDTVLATLLGHAEAKGLISWEVSVDSTVNRAHQHATNLPCAHGGPVELQESAR